MRSPQFLGLTCVRVLALLLAGAGLAAPINSAAAQGHGKPPAPTAPPAVQPNFCTPPNCPGGGPAVCVSGGGSVTWPENTTGHKGTFTVTSCGSTLAVWSTACTTTGSAVCNNTTSSCNAGYPGNSCTTTVTYSVGPVGSGTVTMTATEAQSGYKSSGTYAVTVAAGPPEVAVTTYHGDALRTGWNQHEQTLTPTNVPGSVGLIYSITLDDQVDAQPLVVPHVSIAGGTHDVVYVATENNTVYAIEPATGAVLLSRHLGPPRPMNFGCNNNGPNVGINATPVIDSTSNTMYVVTYTVETSLPVYRIHALDLSTLADKVGSGVFITASHTLTNGATFTFDAANQRQRPGLLKANGNIYAGFGSFCDFGGSSSRGWLLGWQMGSLTPLAGNQLNDRRQPSSETFLSAIWMSGYGVAADSVGNPYFITGNSQSGTYDGAGYTNIQESVVKLSPDLMNVLGLFTPSSVNLLDQQDSDFGSGGALLLPDQPGSIPHLAVAAGKTTGMYVLNRDALGSVVAGPFAIGGCWCGQSYFVGADAIGRVVTSGGANAIVWKVQTSPSVTLTQESSSAALTTGQDPGFFTSVSSNGTQTGSAIIWAVTRPTDSNPANVTLYALNGANGATLLTATAGAWPNTGGNANIVPVVANGLVFVASNQQLRIFGLN
jgi:hypothetical protein